MRQVYELRITLRRTNPPIWRRVAVPADITLGQLHEVIQIAMGWSDCHLHLFTRRRPALKPTARDRARTAAMFRSGRIEEILSAERPFGPPGYGLDAEDEDMAILTDVCPDVKSKLLYTYDMGDGWNHDIAVQKVHEAKPGVQYPACLGGKKACPPEDCGGVCNYYAMLAVLADPDHERHEELVEEIGAFDPEPFDLDEINRRLHRWRQAQSLRRRRRAVRRRESRRSAGTSWI